MLVETKHYKIETSRGCILNSSIYPEIITNRPYSCALGKAFIKTDSIVIHIDLEKLKKYLDWNHDDQKCLYQMLENLENTRKIAYKSKDYIF